MAQISGINFNSEDFEWSRAPLASMEDLSVVNTPIPTPTAGQSPKSRARWSHRSSSGMTLDNMLGPINEIGEEDQEDLEQGFNQIPPEAAQVGHETLEYVNTEEESPKAPLDAYKINTYSITAQPYLETNEKSAIDGILNNKGPYENDSGKIHHLGCTTNEEESQSLSNTPLLTNIQYQADFSCYSDQRETFSVVLDKYQDINNQERSNQVPDNVQKSPEPMSITPISNNSNDVPLLHGDFNQDPLSHIQWPKSSYEPEGNYAKTMSLHTSPSMQPTPFFDPHYNKRRNTTSARWRTCDVIPEEENMQIFSSMEYEQKYLKHDQQSRYSSETDSLILRPRQVQFISPKHKRKSSRNHEMAGSSEKVASFPNVINLPQKSFVQSKQFSSEMASLIRANDGSIDGAKCNMQPKDRCPKSI